MKPFLFVLSFVLLFAGCEEVKDEPITNPLVENTPECILVFAIDPSSPFRDNLLNETGLWDFWIGTMTNYARQTVGRKCRMIVTPITGDNINWFHGSMSDFKEAVQTPEDLKNMLRREVRRQSTPYESLADTVDYLLKIPGVSEVKTSVWLVVMGNMYDESPPMRITQSLARFRNVSGGLCFEWPNRAAIDNIDAIMVNAGYPKFKWNDTWKPSPLFEQQQ